MIDRPPDRSLSRRCAPEEPDPDPEPQPEHNRLRDLVDQVAILEGKIDELAEASAQPARRSGTGVVVSASVALVLAAGLVLGTAHPALTAAVAATWGSVVGGAPPPPARGRRCREPRAIAAATSKEADLAPDCPSPRFTERGTDEVGGGAGSRLGFWWAVALGGLPRDRSVIVIGTDCPVLRRAHLDAAAARLAQGCDVVLGSDTPAATTSSHSLDPTRGDSPCRPRCGGSGRQRSHHRRRSHGRAPCRFIDPRTRPGHSPPTRPRCSPIPGYLPRSPCCCAQAATITTPRNPWGGVSARSG